MASVVPGLRRFAPFPLPYHGLSYAKAKARPAVAGLLLDQMKKSVENLTHYLREAAIGRYFVASWQIKDTLVVYWRYLGRLLHYMRPRCSCFRSDSGVFQTPWTFRRQKTTEVHHGSRKNTRHILQLALQTKPCELQPKDSRSLQRSTRLFVYRSLCLLCAT